MKPTANQNSGLSIVELLVATAISLIALYGAFKLVTGLLRIGSRVNSVAELDDLKLELLGQVDCDATFPLGKAAACSAAGQLLTVKSRAKTLVTKNSPYTHAGKFVVRAECSADLDSIVLRVARMRIESLNSTVPTHFLPDPVTGVLSTWADPNSLLFGSGISLCRGQKPPTAAVAESGSRRFTFPDAGASGPGCSACGNLTEDFSITLSAPSDVIFMATQVGRAMVGGTGNNTNLQTSIAVNGGACASNRAIANRVGPMSVATACFKSLGAGTHQVTALTRTWADVRNRVMTVQWVAVPK